MKLLAFALFLALAKANIAKGPSIFEYEDKVYFTVAPAVRVNIFQRVANSTKVTEVDNIILNGTATAFAASSYEKANYTVMEVNFNWDGVRFMGTKDNNTNLTSLSIKLTFTRKLRTYSLTGANITSATFNGTRLTNNSLQVHALCHCRNYVCCFQDY